MMSKTSLNSSVIAKNLSSASISLSTRSSIVSEDKNNIASIYQMWSSISMQITEYNNIIVIPSRMFLLWNSEDRSYLISQYRIITAEDGMFVADCWLPRIFLGPVSHFRSKNLHCMDGCIPALLNNSVVKSQHMLTTMKLLSNSQSMLQFPASPKLSPNTINRSSHGSQKRPPNSWILYRKAKHGETVSRNPGLTNNQISTLISTMWATEPKEVRDAFKDLADRAKRQHAVENPGYRYRPRKPSEVKRRQKKSRIRENKRSEPTLVEPLSDSSTLFSHQQVLNAFNSTKSLSEVQMLDYPEDSEFQIKASSNLWSPNVDPSLTTSESTFSSNSMTIPPTGIDEIDFDQWFSAIVFTSLLRQYTQIIYHRALLRSTCSVNL